MGNSNSISIEEKYITLTLIQNNKNINISGFKDFKLNINVVKGTLVKNALEDFNKFRRPNKRIYCLNINDINKVINNNMEIYIVLP
jgi:hypothetical protein